MLGTPMRGRGSVSELEDLVQEVFLQVYRSLAQFRGKAKVSTWIYRIAVNVVLMHRRMARSRPALHLTADVTTSSSSTPMPDDEMTRKANVEALYRLLSQLAEKKRTVYVLHELEGLSSAEIAQIVDVPILTVRTRLFYARRELLELLRHDPHLSTVLDELDAKDERNQQGESLSHDGNLERTVPEGTKIIESAVCLTAPQLAAMAKSEHAQVAKTSKGQNPKSRNGQT
jgi:RNA polymerase sigma-70 factor (ECF subfamily)